MKYDYKKVLDLLNEHGEAACVFELGGSATIRHALELAIALQPKPISELPQNMKLWNNIIITPDDKHFYDISALPKPEVAE